MDPAEQQVPLFSEQLEDPPIGPSEAPHDFNVEHLGDEIQRATLETMSDKIDNQTFVLTGLYAPNPKGREYNEVLERLLKEQKESKGYACQHEPYQSLSSTTLKFTPACTGAIPVT